jgi:hypothetical protein
MAIVVKISCWLWNQMFQYAFGRYLAIKKKTKLKLDITEYKTDKLRKYELKYFHIQEHFAKKSEIPLYKIRNINTIKNGVVKYIVNFILNIFIYKILVHLIPWYVQEKDMAFDKRYLGTKDNNYLSWFRQSYRYFDDIRDILLKDFTSKKALDTENKKIADKMEKCTSVAIHFRRSDYVTQVSLFKPNLVPCSLEYYQKATKYIEKKVKNPIYFIFSDDPERVQEHFKTNKKCIFITWNKWDNNYKDMILMSSCKHTIIANSSFSRRWAWLNKNQNKIVIGPRKWFNKKKLNGKTKDLSPKEWIRL